MLAKAHALYNYPMGAHLSPRQLFAMLFMAFSVLLAIALVSAWTGPTAKPPNNNVAAPVNVGTVDQAKNGSLGANFFAVIGNTLLDGTNGDCNADGVNSYLNFGVTDTENEVV